MAVVGVVLVSGGWVTSGGFSPGRSLVGSMPAGYVRVSQTFAVSAGTFDSGGQLSCAAGKVAWGGGIGFVSAYANDSLNTSAIDGSAGWQGRANDPPGDPNTVLLVDLICAKKPRLYRMQSTLVDDPAGSQTSGSATCPTGTVLLSGSVISDGDTTSEYLTSAWPTNSKTFEAVQENQSTSDQPFDVLALCAKKPPGYVIVNVTATAPPGISSASPICPTGTVPIGGGIHVATPSPAIVPLYNSVTTQGWVTETSNSTTSATQIASYAICAS